MSFPNAAYPLNPILCRLTRGQQVESVHRGAWCLVDSGGRVLDGAGDPHAPYFVRSAIKAIQALPLLETGALECFGFSESELALCMASHSGEACHTEGVAAVLERLGLGEEHLKCGVHPPNDPSARRALQKAEQEPGPLHNNCSGKHMGFLALGKHLGESPDAYLAPESEGQRLVRAALSALTDMPQAELLPGIDGCSAPTFALPLVKLAQAFARVANPGDLGPERAAHFARMTRAAAAHPELIAGRYKRIDTDLLRASGGRLFAKVGAEAMHVVGVGGADCALAIKMDDGNLRGLHVVLLGLLERLGLLADLEQLEPLKRWRDPVLRNYAGLEVGRMEAVFAG